jgi:hypothetical protein
MAQNSSQLAEQIIEVFESLSPNEQRRMLSRLKSLASDDRSGIDGFVDKLRDKRFRKGFACP